MALSITYTMMILISGLGVIDKELSKKARIIMGCVSLATLIMLIYTRMNLPTEVIK